MKNLKIITGIFIICVFLFVSNAIGQEGEVFVSLGGGVSLPLSNFASSDDFSDEQDGFAKTGGNFNINFGYRFNEYLSLTGLLSGCVNGYDYVEAQEWLTDNFAESLPDTKWLVETKSWGFGGLMIGATGSLPLVSDRLFFDARLLGGFTYVYSPGIYVTATEIGEEDKYIDIEQSTAASWVVDLGAGLRYNRTRNQYFILYADYMHAQPYFDDVRTNTNFGFERDDAYTIPISTINISLGIGYIVN
jgi:hypothetical protein